MTMPPANALRPRPKNFAEYMQLWDEQQAPAPLPTLRLRDSDIVIAAFPKSGATWVQQIVHGLRTGGSMDFEDISLVVPWIELAPVVGIDLDAPQVAQPRAFKTHLCWNEVPKGGRYIYVIRNPADALLSQYYFESGIFFEPGTVNLAEHSTATFLQSRSGPSYWQHLRSYLQERHREEVLLLCFEDMKLDLEGAVRRIAAFIGIKDTEECIATATRQAGYEFMRAHDHLFNDHATISVGLRHFRLPDNVFAAKVRAGRTGDGERQLPASVSSKLAELWEREIAVPLNLPSYESLRECLKGR